MRAGDDATEKLRSTLNEVLTPVEKLANEIAQRERRQYLGIDTSPAPAKDRSIAVAIEALTRAPFGSAGTLEACSIITAALKSVSVRTCGYSGLMLPVLEDPLLAMRAGENRYSIRDVLLYSSVCGTGLDVVPIPGNTSPDSINGLLRDVASGHPPSQAALGAIVSRSRQESRRHGALRRSGAHRFGRNEAGLSLARAREMRAAMRRPRMKMTSAPTGM